MRRWRTRHRLPAEDSRAEALFADRELEQVEELTVLLEPRHRRPDAELDATHGIGLVADGCLLSPAQLLLRVAQDLDEKLFFCREVPIEDALADAEALHDLGDGRAVVAVLGEARGGVLHRLPA